MQRCFPAGSVFGIPIVLTRDWFIALIVVVVVLGAAIYPYVLTDQAQAAVWLLALVTAACFFGGLLLHEVGHAWGARRARVPVQGITLRALGGVTHTSGRFPRLGQIVVYVVAGPAVTLVLGLALLLPALLLPGRTPWRVLLAWSALMQLAADAVNLVPAGTLDGGRLLHAARLVARPRRRRLALTLVWLVWLLTLALALLGGLLAHRM